MCFRPRRIRNPYYLPSKKNNYDPPLSVGVDDKYIDVPCGECFDCRRRYGNDWRFRLLQEYKYSEDRRFNFVTLTISDYHFNQELSKMAEKGLEIEDDNSVVTFMVRKFLERYRKIYKKSLRHWFVTELGEEFGRIHLHGIVVGCECGIWIKDRYYIDKEEFERLWKYGFTWLGWFNERTCSYIVKYITKIDQAHPEFKPKVLTSPRMGSEYIKRYELWHYNNFEIDKMRFYCMSENGWKVSMPRYYRDKIFDEDVRSAHRGYLLDNPPLKVYKGREYTEIGYMRKMLFLHDETKSLGLTYLKETGTADSLKTADLNVLLNQFNYGKD